MIILQALALGVYGFVILSGFIIAALLTLSIIAVIVRAVRKFGECDRRDL